jgi:hypothetical protein
VQLSLVIADMAMPAAGPIVLDTAFSVQWANATVPDAALRVGVQDSAIASCGIVLHSVHTPLSSTGVPYKAVFPSLPSIHPFTHSASMELTVTPSAKGHC